MLRTGSHRFAPVGPVACMTRFSSHTVSRCGRFSPARGTAWARRPAGQSGHGRPAHSGGRLRHRPGNAPCHADHAARTRRHRSGMTRRKLGEWPGPSMAQTTFDGTGCGPWWHKHPRSPGSAGYTWSSPRHLPHQGRHRHTLCRPARSRNRPRCRRLGRRLEVADRGASAASHVRNSLAYPPSGCGSSGSKSSGYDALARGMPVPPTGME